MFQITVTIKILTFVVNIIRLIIEGSFYRGKINGLDNVPLYNPMYRTVSL